jgi:hypothetical protein
MIEVENFFTPFYQQQIIKLVTSRRFNWNYRPKLNLHKLGYLQKFFDNDSNIINHEGFSHTFYKKDKASCKTLIGKKNLLDLFIFYTEKNFNIKVNSALRLTCMFSLPNTQIKDNNYLLPHIDYFMPHNTLLYYANTVDGDTVIFEDKADIKENYSHLEYEHLLYKINNFDTKIIKKRISPTQGKAVLFDGLHFHSGNVPKTSERFVFNFNFT